MNSNHEVLADPSAAEQSMPESVCVSLAHVWEHGTHLSIQAVASPHQHMLKARLGIDRRQGIEGIARALGMEGNDVVRSMAERRVRSLPPNLTFRRLKQSDRARTLAVLELRDEALADVLFDRADDLLAQDYGTTESSGLSCAWSSDGFVFVTNNSQVADRLERLFAGFRALDILVMEPRLPNSLAMCLGLGLQLAQSLASELVHVNDVFDTAIAYAHDRVRASGLLERLEKHGTPARAWDASVLDIGGDSQVFVSLHLVDGSKPSDSLRHLLARYA